MADSANLASSNMRGNRIAHKTKYRGKMIALCQQFKDAINEHIEKTGKNAAKMFQEFDEDGGGEIDKAEFIHGISRLGIQVEKNQMDILWPLVCFDKPEISMHVSLVDRACTP
jgi:Ca2+-binding EF-hand superfamily protein